MPNKKVPKEKQRTIKKNNYKSISIANLLKKPFICPNCDEKIHGAGLYCSDLCKDEAKFVRYYRARIGDGTDKKADIDDAIKMKCAHILGGGYNEKKRRLPNEIRKQVFERDKGRCRKCGAPGNQIDHIEGDSNELKNLQLLCRRCHNEKTKLKFKKITHPDKLSKLNALLFRVHLPYPFKACDSPDWKKNWKYIWTKRKKSL